MKKACFLVILAFLYYVFIQSPTVTLTELSISYVIFALPKIYSLEANKRIVTKAAAIEETHLREHLIVGLERIWRKDFVLFLLLSILTNVIIWSPDFHFQIELFSHVGNRVGAVDVVQAVRFAVTFFLLTEFFQTCFDIYRQRQLNSGIDAIVLAQEKFAKLIEAETKLNEIQEKIIK